MSETKKSSDFKVVASAPALTMGKNTYFISLQEISQDNGSSSQHYVIKKQHMNADGSPRGISKQIFVPVADIEVVIKQLQTFVKEQK